MKLYPFSNGELNKSNQHVWTSVTEETITKHLESNEVFPPMDGVYVTVNILKQVYENNSQRYLQEQARDDSTLHIIFNVTMEYRSETNEYDPDKLVYGTFGSLRENVAYIYALQDESSTFDGVELVQVDVKGYEPPQPTPAPTSESEDRDSVDIAVIFGSTIGGAALIILIVLLFLRRCGDKYASEDMEHDEEREEVGALPSMKKNVKVSTEILVEPQDDISTLGDPMWGPGGMILGGIEKDEATATVGDDYDYTKQYRATRDPLSIAGTTNTHDRTTSEDMSKLSSNQSLSMSKLGKMGEILFADDHSFEEQFSDPEERFNVVAPAGKLGMVIDTPNRGIPVVHAIKDTSVLFDQVRVGDRLISVDGEDCTGMTAMQVSKLISLKSEKPVRVLVFTRTLNTNTQPQ